MSLVKDKLLQLKQEVNSIGSSIPMDYIKLDFIEKMEFEAEHKRAFREALTLIELLVDKVLLNVEDYNSLVEIKNIYSEVYVLSKLQALLSIEKVPECDSKTPDFMVRFRAGEIYIELKSLNMLDGNMKQKKIMYDSLDSKITAEEQISNGAIVGFGEHVIQPYFSPNNEYDPRSIRVVIESLVDKINQNIKEDQFSSGDTVLLVDLSDQLLLISAPSEAIQEKYVDRIGGGKASGELWNVAFGKVGDMILKPAEFEGAEKFDGRLEKEGILVTHPFVKGLIFHADENFYSFAEVTEYNMNVIHCLEYLSKQHVSK